MIFLYNLGIQLYLLLIRIAALRNTKAKQWLNGQEETLQNISTQITTNKRYIWFHFASLGEFEQGRPVMEQIKKEYPEDQLFITFFSPSGYEVRKNNTLSELTYYLPVDTKKNARKLIELINPKIAVFTKYEYWYHYFNELKGRKIPVYVISANFMKGMSFFRWYGKLNREMLKFVTHFFVQNRTSKILLATLNFHNVTVTGDTRFDRVTQNSTSPKKLEIIERFCLDKKVFIGGSTWPEEEILIAGLAQEYPDWKFILAPHEVGEEKIGNLEELIPDNSIRYSVLKTEDDSLSDESRSPVQHQILIIDNIGMLSALYQYANIAYIGGAFGSGLHNVLEAAAFGIPVIFGPKIDRFPEARDLIGKGAGFSIENSADLHKIMGDLQNEDDRLIAGEAAKKYVEENTGATGLIMDHIRAAL